MIELKKKKEEELVKIIKAVYQNNNASTQKYTDMIEALQVERHKINEEIQRLMIELRNVLASIAHLQTEINHYRILLNPNEIPIFEKIEPKARTPSPIQIKTPSPPPPKTPSPSITPVPSSPRPI